MKGTIELSNRVIVEIILAVLILGAIIVLFLKSVGILIF